MAGFTDIFPGIYNRLISLWEMHRGRVRTIFYTLQAKYKKGEEEYEK
jgi:hypothetical protein